jgi:hypothetical protein
MWKEYEAARQRQAELLEEAQSRKSARLARHRAVPGSSLRARVARGLVGAAFALETRETWRAVWERMIVRDRA